VRSRITDRHVHLTTEDERNIISLHERDPGGRPKLYSGEWNDDIHHVAHVIATGENEGYYADYVDDPVGGWAKALATGFVYQGERSTFRESNRGVPSAALPPAAFVDFLQNHDQIGNRAFSERLTALAEPDIVETLTAVLLLSPHIPLLFMGEEWGETRPFGFFTDFHGELGDAVREGRRREFSRWPAFASEESRNKIADPNAKSTFDASRLDWDKLDQSSHRERFDLAKRLLDIRRREIVPLLSRIGGHAGSSERLADRAFVVRWRTEDGRILSLAVNLGDEPVSLGASSGRAVFERNASAERSEVGPLGVLATIEEGTDFVPLPE